MIFGGDVNTAKQGKHGHKLYHELTGRLQWPSVDSADEWSEDDDAPHDQPWPPTGRNQALAQDLWRETPATSREHGGLQSGSTCLQAGLQNFHGLQGIAARALNERWPDGGPCSDNGHIDWLLASRIGAKVTPRSVGVCTERVCPPLKPQQPSLLGDVLPIGGAVFASDHYPVWADVELPEPPSPPQH